MAPEDRFDGVSPAARGRRLGSPALRYQGRIIAVLTHGRLSVKLPRPRVDELVDDGTGTRYDNLREWLVLSPVSAIPWLGLVKEALAHAQRPR